MLGFIPEARAWYKIAIARDPLDAASQKALFHLNAESHSKSGSAERLKPPASPSNP